LVSATLATWNTHPTPSGGSVNVGGQGVRDCCGHSSGQRTHTACVSMMPPFHHTQSLVSQSSSSMSTSRHEKSTMSPLRATWPPRVRAVHSQASHGATCSAIGGAPLASVVFVGGGGLREVLHQSMSSCGIIGDVEKGKCTVQVFFFLINLQGR
jgi:hypothetical protein